MTVEIWATVSNHIPYKMMVITYPCHDLSLMVITPEYVNQFLRGDFVVSKDYMFTQ